MSKQQKINLIAFGIAGLIIVASFNISFSPKVKVPDINQGEGGSPGGNGYVSISW